MESNNKSWGEKRTAFVVVIALVAMALEITIGLYANSMALFADGIHQATHVLVIGLSWGAYILVRRLEARGDRVYDHDKVLGLAAYTSGVLLSVFALFILGQAVHRFTEPEVQIRYVEALVIAGIGLVVSSVCASVLHTSHGEGDYNSRSAYLHVLSDVLTSIGAIIGLLCGMIWNIVWLDAVVALLSALVILRWAWKLLCDTGRMLSRK
ncbi:MAG: cation diffusion facilitator family transporter [Prevotella sp.]|nr:cation diffusion facilitator family transporter [Prevotella sp.]